MKRKLTIAEAKLQVAELLGKKVNIKLNKGRNKIVNCKGIVKNVYENVFEIEIPTEITGKLTLSYADVVCKEIVLKSCE